MAKRLTDSPTSRYFYPWPICLVTTIGAEGRPNIITIGASSICSSNPPIVGVAIGQAQYSLELIKETGDFGVNLPSADQMKQTDICGTRSGQTVDKFSACGFTVQPGSQIRSPLIEECPVSMECELVQSVALGNHEWVMGRIVAVHVDEEILDEASNLDSGKAQPLLGVWGEYWSIGEKLGDWHYTRR